MTATGAPSPAAAPAYPPGCCPRLQAAGDIDNTEDCRGTGHTPARYSPRTNSAHGMFLITVQPPYLSLPFCPRLYNIHDRESMQSRLAGAEVGGMA